MQNYFNSEALLFMDFEGQPKAHYKSRPLMRQTEYESHFALVKFCRK